MKGIMSREGGKETEGGISWTGEQYGPEAQLGLRDKASEVLWSRPSGGHRQPQGSSHLAVD